MKKEYLVVGLFLLSGALTGKSAEACYVGPHIRCCYPMIGCDFNTESFNSKIQNLIDSATSKEEVEQILNGIKVEQVETDHSGTGSEEISLSKPDSRPALSCPSGTHESRCSIWGGNSEDIPCCRKN